MNHQDPLRHLPELPRVATPPGLEERLAAALPAEMAAVRPLPGIALRTLLTFALLTLAGAGLGFLAGGKGWKAMDFEQRLALVSLLLLGGAWLSWELALRMLPAVRLLTSGAGPAAAALAAVCGWAWWLNPPGGQSRLFYAICLAYTTAGVALGFWLTRFWLRRGFRATGVFSWPIAASTGLAGFAAVQFFCPFLDAAHILTSHVAPAIAGGLLAARLHAILGGSSR